MVVSVSAVFAFMPLAAPAAGQTGVAGDWVATWDSGVRSQGAEVLEVTSRMQATLHLEQTGDSVRGTWTNGRGERSAWEVRGTFRSGVLEMESDVGEVESNGQKVYVRVRWQGRLTGGALSGSMYVRLRGPECTENGRLCDNEPPIRRWEAVRRPG
jgi:hypothetical protein